MSVLLVTRAAVRRLRRMRARVVGISLVIGLAMAMVVSGMYGGEVLDQSVSDYFAAGRMPDLFVRLEGGEDASAISAALDAVPGVAAYELEQTAIGTTWTSANEAIDANMVGLADPSRTDIGKLELVAGRLFSSPGEAVAVAGMEAKGFGVGDGPSVQVGSHALGLEVVGVVRGAEYVFTSALSGYIVPAVGSAVVLIVPLGTLPSFAAGQVNQVNVLLGDQGSQGEALAALQPFGVVSVLEQKDHPSTIFINLGSQKIKTMMPMIGYVFLAIGLVSVFMTMARVVLSDTRQVGVLMALGYRKGEIARGYLATGTVLAGLGVLIGVPLALLLTMGFVQAMMSIFFQLTVSFPFDPLPFLLGGLVVVASVMAAIAVPVLLVTRRTVRDALEYRPEDRVRTSRVGRLRGSMISRMGLRNAVRKPVRTLFTVLVIAMTIGLAGSWLVMTDSAFGYIQEQIDADTWDLRAELTSARDTSSVNAALLGLPPSEVAYLAPAAQVRAVVSHGSDSSTAMLYAADDWPRIRDMRLLQGDLGFGGLVMTKDLADELGLGIGDNVEASLGSDSAMLAVTGIVSDVLSRTAYTSRAALAPLFPETSSNLAFVSLAQPSKANELAVDMRTMPSISYVLVHSDLSETMDQTVGLAIGMLYAFFGISMLITIIVTGVAVMISTLERDMEYATLSTLGASRGQVAKGIAVEMLALGGFSVLAAVPISYLISAMLAQAMSQVVFYFPVSISVEATALMVIVGLLLVLASSGIPLRYVRRLKTSQVLKERNPG